MSLLKILIVLILIGFIIWIINTSPPIKRIIIMAVSILLIGWVLKVLGFLTYLGSIYL